MTAYDHIYTDNSFPSDMRKNKLLGKTYLKIDKTMTEKSFIIFKYNCGGKYIHYKNIDEYIKQYQPQMDNYTKGEYFNTSELVFDWQPQKPKFYFISTGESLLKDYKQIKSWICAVFKIVYNFEPNIVVLLPLDKSINSWHYDENRCDNWSHFIITNFSFQNSVEASNFTKYFLTPVLEEYFPDILVCDVNKPIESYKLPFNTGSNHCSLLPQDFDGSIKDLIITNVVNTQILPKIISKSQDKIIILINNLGWHDGRLFGWNYRESEYAPEFNISDIPQLKRRLIPVVKQRHFIYKSNELYGSKFTYNKVKYTTDDKNVIITCKHDHDFLRNPIQHVNSYQKCPKCTKCPSCGLFKTNGKLCEYCIPTTINKIYQKQYVKSKEYDVVNYLKANLNEEFIHNRSVGAECTGTHLYPDILFKRDKYNVIIEIDEHAHRGASYQCDEKRMFDVVAKLGLPTIFIRYNPDNKRSDKELLLKCVKFYLSEHGENIWDETSGLHVEYLFYDKHTNYSQYPILYPYDI